MCGIVAIAGTPTAADTVTHATRVLQHRGPDAEGTWSDASADVALGHRRLSIIDLSPFGRQPMASADGRFTITFNGEIYNYLELRAELSDYPFRSHSDTEVVLAAWSCWGERCLDRFLGMFAFVLWDGQQQTLFAVRDRFGVKPLYYSSLKDGGIALASEIKALHAAGVPPRPRLDSWATYLVSGISEGSARTFWEGIEAVPAGCILSWSAGRSPRVRRWYDVALHVGPAYDERSEADARDEYLALLHDSVRLRFRSDVPVAINLSGGLDSSLLLGLVHSIFGRESDLKIFTFTTGDERYDELPWVRAMLEHTCHPLFICELAVEDVPALARDIASAADEPYGGLPTLAYANLFRRARREGIVVLLDGQGIDEQWAGYDYYGRVSTAHAAPITQGGSSSALRPECVAAELAALATPLEPIHGFPDALRDLQLRDITVTKLPRALRFNDRISMAASTELREPFLDHRLVELALRQPAERKIHDGVHKRLVRTIAQSLLPEGVRLAPKRPVQTPQREWLREGLRDWADAMIERMLRSHPDWFDARRVRDTWARYVAGEGDNSFWVWQWISVGLACDLDARGN